MKFIVQILISAVAVFLVSSMLPGIEVKDYLSALLVAVVLAFLNQIVKPILTILTIPITVFTLGFFLLALNAFMVMLAGKLVPDFYVRGFWSALLFSVILSIITGIMTSLFGVRENRDEKNDY